MNDAVPDFPQTLKYAVSVQLFGMFEHRQLLNDGRRPRRGSEGLAHIRRQDHLI